MINKENWDELTTNEKYNKRMESFLNPEIIFASKEVEEKYKKNAQRYKDAIELKKPDRVPISPNMGFYPARYAGITAEEAMHDYEKMSMAWMKFNNDFGFDYLQSCAASGSGLLFAKLDLKLYKWPGHGTKTDIPYQCVEKEYMKADEYDELIEDPSAFFMKIYLPRIFGSLEAWGKLPIFPSFIELPFIGSGMVSIGMPDIQESFEKFMEAGQEAWKWAEVVGKTNREIIAVNGIPSNSGGYTKAPFDILGDTLRGTKEIMLDMYRRPEKILKAMDTLAPIAIKMGINACDSSENLFVKIPLHKGEDSFMSREQFAEFYWPTLKKVLLGLIEDGCVPSLFAEGSYNNRLDFITDPDLPKGKIYWYFDKTDMVEVKKYLSGKAAFGGNVPASLLKTGTTNEVEEYVRNLMDKVAGDGGYILTTGAVIDDAKDENIKSMVEAGKKYGKY